MIIIPSNNFKGNLIQRNNRRIKSVNELKNTHKLYNIIDEIDKSLKNNNEYIFKENINTIFLEEIPDILINTYFERLKCIANIKSRFVDIYNEHSHKGYCFTMKKIWRS